MHEHSTSYMNACRLFWLVLVHALYMSTLVCNNGYTFTGNTTIITCMEISIVSKDDNHRVQHDAAMNSYACFPFPFHFCVMLYMPAIHALALCSLLLCPLLTIIQVLLPSMVLFPPNLYTLSVIRSQLPQLTSLHSKSQSTIIIIIYQEYTYVHSAV